MQRQVGNISICSSDPIHTSLRKLCMAQTQNQLQSVPQNSYSSEKLLASQIELYKHLLLLFALDPTAGERDKATTPPEKIPQRIQRSFLNSIAYICDYKKGGATTSAAAFQVTQHGLVLRLACNDSLPKEKFESLQKIIYSIKTCKSTDALLDEIALFSNLRLETYSKFVIRDCKKCILSLSQVEPCRMHITP